MIGVRAPVTAGEAHGDADPDEADMPGCAPDVNEGEEDEDGQEICGALRCEAPDLGDD
jgi:hypothetical protein